MQGAAVRDTALLIQQAAAELLALLCSTDSQTCQLLIADNGLNALASMMPEPPTVPGADSNPRQPEQAADNSTNGSSSNSSNAAPRPASTDGKTKAGGVPPLVLGGDADSTGGGAVPPSPRRQVGGVHKNVSEGFRAGCGYHKLLIFKHGQLTCAWNIVFVHMRWHATTALVGVLLHLHDREASCRRPCVTCAAGSWNTQVTSCYTSWRPTLGHTSSPHRF